MPAFQHIYVTAHGEWNTPNWTGETAQMGVRLCTTYGADEPPKGSIFTPSPNGDVTIDSGTATGTHGTLARTWEGRLGPVGSLDNADAAMQVDLAEDFWTYLNAIKVYNSTYFRWTHIKIAPILADGTYGAPSAIYQFTTPLSGTGSSPTAAPEVALAVSFRAGIIGRRGRGRMYLPGLSVTATHSGDGTVQGAVQTALLSATSTLVTNLEDMPGTEEWGPTLAVMSAGSATAVRPAELRVGNHFDAQRRRQHQVPESYAVSAL